MSDFTPLQALGPFRKVDPSAELPGGDHLERYLGHYGLAPLLARHVGLHLGFLDAGDFRLWASLWSPAEPIGTVFVVHGYFDHLGLYRHLLERLLDRGWRVVLWDLPGHGLSSGRRASIEDFDDYGACLRALQEHLQREGLAPHPWLGIGQSTGAAILATDALTRGTDSHWAGLALLAPLVRPWGWRQSSWLHLLVGPFVRSIPRKFRDNSTDAEFATFLREQDPLQADRLAVDWVSAMRRWMPRLLALPPTPVPTLILQGEQDLTVDWVWNLGVLKEKFPNAEVHLHPEARHHLVNEAEPIRQALFDNLDRFIDALAPSPAAENAPP
ncbi:MULTISPECIES: alpha/beta hydrolase [unclassified Halomonas]|uniref:alpha/beta hydrolase n=1 Tax=unclassified Halomonas TaxID=2609666 RepID=UPI0028889E29|nr:MULTISPECIES: alpha/beta hydrolase [unclassified Halomonas]MDT0500109.1 alpha/beta hydrolase [Halomonas sp. PAR7]MDT0512513.1 alpha/beta hydrolase [Halomonas sp. LES1]MDT0591147.1 alpha/beta hydrolase [Halomonas sp. PAR8]